MFWSSLKGISIDHGLSSITPDSKPPSHAIGTLLFDSVESLYEAVTPHMETFLADVPKYSSQQPTIQISDVKIND